MKCNNITLHFPALYALSASRRFVLVLLLCLAQLLAQSHELGHARDDAGTASDNCAICLVAHALAAALAPALPSIAVLPSGLAMAAPETAALRYAAVPQPTQRGPPTA